MTDLATLLPQQAIFSQTPSAVLTPNTLSNAFGAVAMPAFAAPQATPAAQVIVDPKELLQDWLGCGAAITDSTAYCLITYLTPADRAALLKKVFGTGAPMIRIAIGDPDFVAHALPWFAAGDPAGLARQAEYVIPVLQQIIAINPRVKIVASPWTPPASMKTSGSLTSGSMNATSGNLTTYAQTFVTFIQTYASYGIPIWGVTVQNEPNVTSAGYPCCGWASADMATFIGSYLGEAFDAAGIVCNIAPGDASWGDASTFVTTSLSSSTAAPYTTFAAYHGYDGAPLKAAQDLRAYSKRPWLMTEASSGSVGVSGTTSVAQDQAWCASTLACDGVKFGMSGFIFWNLLQDQAGLPNQGNKGTIGSAASSNLRPVVNVQNTGTTAASGALTYNPEFYLLQHFSFAKPGARVCKTQVLGPAGLKAISIVNTDGSAMTFLTNQGSATVAVAVVDAVTNLSSPITLNVGDMATVTWNTGAAQITGAGSFVAPGAPTLGTPTFTNDTVSIPITAPTSAGSGVAGYLFKRGSAAGGETQIAGAVPIGGTFTDTDLLFNTTIYYTAQTYGIGGFSGASNEVSILTTAAPSSVTLGGSAGSGQNVLTFSALANGAVVSSFQVLRGTVASGESASPLATVPTSSSATSGPVSGTYTDTTAANGIAYYYEVVAVSTAGNITSAEVGPLTPSASQSGPAHYLSLSGANNTGSGTTPKTTTEPTVAGYLDIMVWLNLTSYTVSGSGLTPIISNYAGSGASASNSEWLAGFNSSGQMLVEGYTAAGSYVISGSGTGAGNVISSLSPSPTLGVWLRWVINATSGAVNGFAAGTTTFMGAAGGSAVPSSWTTLAAISGGFNSNGIKNNGASAAGIRVGSNDSVTANTPPNGQVYKAIVKDSSGVILANPDFTTGTAPTVDTAATPNTYALYGAGATLV